jgi:hypothetical protein
VTTVAVIAMAEVGRALRFVNVLLGGWIAVAAWTLGAVSGAARWIGLAAGIAVIVVSIPRGAVREVYGRWQRAVT